MKQTSSKRTWASGSMCRSTDWLKPTCVRRPRSFKYWTTRQYGNCWITPLFWVSLKLTLWWHLTCEERLMSVVTTSTMTITVSNTLDKPTRGSTLEWDSLSTKGTKEQPPNQPLWPFLSCCDWKSEQKPWFSSLGWTYVHIKWPLFLKINVVPRDLESRHMLIF